MINLVNMFDLRPCLHAAAKDKVEAAKDKVEEVTPSLSDAAASVKAAVREVKTLAPENPTDVNTAATKAAQDNPFSSFFGGVQKALECGAPQFCSSAVSCLSHPHPLPQSHLLHATWCNLRSWCVFITTLQAC